MLMHSVAHRVKLPKTFLAVNLSDAFTFQEKQHHSDNDNDVLEMKSPGQESVDPVGPASSDTLKPVVETEQAPTPVPVDAIPEMPMPQSDPPKPDAGGDGDSGN